MLDKLIALWEREPVAIVGLIDAVLILAASLGLPVDNNVKVAIDGVLGAIGVVLVRSQVSPTPAAK